MLCEVDIIAPHEFLLNKKPTALPLKQPVESPEKLFP
jgi:hypothetical protein